MTSDHLGIAPDDGARVPPHDLLAEQSALGGMMLSKTAAAEVLDILQGRDYYMPKHELIHAAIGALFMRGEPTDVIAVGDEMLKAGTLVRSGGVEYLHTLTGAVPTAANASFYAAIVQEKAVKRRLVEAGTRIVQMGYASEGEPAELVEHAREELDDASSSVASKVMMVRDYLPAVFDALAAKATFVPSPWKTLNAAIGGLRPGAVYVIAARPGVGKTVVAGQIAAGLAEHGNVAFSSLEMSAPELVTRLISERLQINVGRLKDNRLNELDWKTIADGRSRLESLNIAIDDRASVSGVEVRAHAKAVMREGSLAGVVVDYMQLMTSASKMERHLQVSEFARQMKIMAKDLKVPVIALSQLNRKSEDRLDRIPRLADLRESGAIEQDADVVILLRREGDFPNEHLILDVAKNRHGETGEVDLAWEGTYSRATEWVS